MTLELYELRHGIYLTRSSQDSGLTHKNMYFCHDAQLFMTISFKYNCFMSFFKKLPDAIWDELNFLWKNPGILSMNEFGRFLSSDKNYVSNCTCLDCARFPIIFFKFSRCVSRFCSI